MEYRRNEWVLHKPIVNIHSLKERTMAMPCQIQRSSDAFVGRSMLKTKLEDCPVVFVLTHEIVLFQIILRKARNVLVTYIIIWFSIIQGCMHKWVDQFGCHVSQFCLVIVIAMPMLLYRSWNLLKWTRFKYFNLKIYMMHKQFHKLIFFVKAMDFWTQNSWTIHLTAIFLWIMI
jgi:hypothetical protein